MIARQLPPPLHPQNSLWTTTPREGFLLGTIPLWPIWTMPSTPQQFSSTTIPNCVQDVSKQVLWRENSPLGIVAPQSSSHITGWWYFIVVGVKQAVAVSFLNTKKELYGDTSLHALPSWFLFITCHSYRSISGDVKFYLHCPGGDTWIACICFAN